jgi:hypothetical protein
VADVARGDDGAAMTDSDAVPKSELILYQTADGRTRIECRFERDTVWLSQALIAELFGHRRRNSEPPPEGDLRRQRAVT